MAFAVAELCVVGLQGYSEPCLCIACLQRKRVACFTEIRKYLLIPFKPEPPWSLESHRRSTYFICLGDFFPLSFLKILLACCLGKRRFWIKAGTDSGLPGRKEDAPHCFLGCCLADRRARTNSSSSDSTVTFLQSSAAAPSASDASAMHTVCSWV